MPILYRRFAHERGEAGVGILYCLDTLTPSPEASLGCSVARWKDGHRAMWNPALTIDYDVQADNGVFGLQVLIPNTVISPDYFSPEDEFVVYQGYGLWGIIKEGAGNSSDYEYSEEWYAQGLFFISITLKYPEMDIGWLDERMLDPLWGVVITEFASCWD